MILTEEQRMIQESVAQLTQKWVRPFRDKWAKEKHFPIEALKELGKAGFLGMLIPESYGGSNLSHVNYVNVLMEIAKADGALSTIVSVQNSLASLPVLNFGSEDQKKKYLPLLTSGEKIGAFCLTEPQAGSDAVNIQTTAKPHSDGFILNGVKQFITSGKNAQLSVVFAQTDANAKSKGITAFIVPTDLKGYNVAKVESKMGQQASEIAQIVFEDMVVSKEYQLGQVGEGYKIALSNLEGGRLGIAAQAIGIAMEAFEHSLQYAKERKSMGKYLFEHQAISFKLADMATQIEAAKQLLYHAATLKDHRMPCIKEAAQAKLFASEMAESVCREAIQIYGGYGYLQDFPLERFYRDVRVTTIYEGTSEVQRMIISKALVV